MSEKLTFVRDVAQKEWSALPRDFKKGDVVFVFDGYDYGCARDDFLIGNRETITCSCVPGKTPFFTIPVEFLIDASGRHPSGPYQRLTPMKSKD